MDLLSNFMNSTGAPGGITLENKHLEKARQYARQFELHGIKAGMEKMLSCCFSELATVGPSGSMGLVNKDSFNTDVLIPLLVTHTGLMLTLEQQGTLKLLSNLMSVTHQPQTLPMKSPKFILKYKTFKQPIATHGQMSTKVPTAGAYYFNIEASLEKRIAGFTMGELDFLFENNPQDVIGVLSERLEALSTTWGVTTIYLHAAYAASQPSVSQLMLAHKVLHQPRDVYAKLIQYCFMEHLMCGALNRSPSNVRTILASFGDSIKLNDKKEFVALFPQECGAGAMAAAKKIMHNGRKRTITYSTTGQGMENYCMFGNVQEEDESEDLEVNALSLPNGTTAMLIPIEGTVDDGSAQPMMTEGYKKLFFTVGGCPAIYESKCNPSFFDGTGDVSPKSVNEFNPGTTYFMDFDRNTTAKITLGDCHKLVASAELFNSSSSYNAWLKVFKKDMLGFVDERKTAKFLHTSKEEMLGSPLMIYEVDPRHMWINDAKNKTAAVKFAAKSTGGGDEYIYYVNRGVLGNASPCSRFENEVVGCVGSLAAIVKPFTMNLTDLIDRMCVELDSVNVDKIIEFRQIKVSAASPDNIIKALQQVMSSQGVISDPICQVIFLQLCAKAFESTDNDLSSYMTANTGFLHKMCDMINGSMKEAASIISTVFGSVYYSAIMGANNTLVVLQPETDFEIPEKFTSYLKFMYGFVMPAISSKVAVVGGTTYTANILTRGISIDLGLGAIPNGVFVPNSYSSTSMDIVAPFGAADDTISIFRPLFSERVKMLRRMFSGIPMVIVLGLIHYWTAWNPATMENHMDKLYYSGLAYLGIRHMKFVGHTLSALPVGGARFLIGNKYAGFPMATWQHTEYKQCMELGVVPYDIGSTGISAPCAFLSCIRGMGASCDLDSFPDGIILADSYNFYLPEGIKCFQSGLPMIPVQGRFGKFELKQDITGKFCELPTAFFKASLMLEFQKESHRGFQPESSLGLFDAALTVDNFMDSVPQCVRMGIEEGFGHKEILNQVVCAKKAPASIFTKFFGGMFTDDYVVGCGSSQLLKQTSYSSKLDCELMPRIYSVGGLNANAIFGAEASDPAFMAAFVKQFSVAKVSNYRNF